MEAKPQNRQIIHTTERDPGIAKGPNGNGHSVILEYKNGQRERKNVRGVGEEIQSKGISNR